MIQSPYTEKLFQHYTERRMTFTCLEEVSQQSLSSTYVIDDMCGLDETAISAFIKDHPHHLFILLSKNPSFYEQGRGQNIVKVISVFNEKQYIIHELFCDRHLVSVYVNFNTLGRKAWYEAFLNHLKKRESTAYQLIIDLNPLSELHQGDAHQLFHLKDSDIKAFIKDLPDYQSHLLDLRYNFKEQLNVPVDYISDLLHDLNEDYDLIYIMDGVGKPNDLKLLTRADKVFLASHEQLSDPVDKALQRMCSYVFF